MTIVTEVKVEGGVPYGHRPLLFLFFSAAYSFVYEKKSFYSNWYKAESEAKEMLERGRREDSVPGLDM